MGLPPQPSNAEALGPLTETYQNQRSKASTATGKNSAGAWASLTCSAVSTWPQATWEVSEGHSCSQGKRQASEEAHSPGALCLSDWGFGGAPPSRCPCVLGPAPLSMRIMGDPRPPQESSAATLLSVRQRVAGASFSSEPFVDFLSGKRYSFLFIFFLSHSFLL